MNNSTSTNVSVLPLPVTATGGSIQVVTLVLDLIIACEGVGMVLGNGLVIASILLYKQLRQRKELLLLVGLSMADLLSGVGYAAFGINRSVLDITLAPPVIVSAWDCMLTVSAIFPLVGAQTSAIMDAIISCDRLLAVAWYGGYLKLTTKYSIKILSAVAAYGIITLTTGFLSSYFQTNHYLPNYPLASCGPTLSTPQWYGMYHYTQPVCGTMLSVALYIAVMIAYWHHVKKTKSQNVQNAQLRRQRQLTKTLGIAALCTFLFHSFPTVLLLYFRFTNPILYSVAGLYLTIIIDFHSLVNVFIYCIRQKDIRKAMWNMVCFKRGNQVTSFGGGTASRLNQPGSKNGSKNVSRNGAATK